VPPPDSEEDDKEKIEFIILCFDQYLQKIQTPNPFILPLISTSCRPFTTKVFTAYLPCDKKKDCYGKIALPGGYLAGSAAVAHNGIFTDPIRAMLRQLSGLDSAFQDVDMSFTHFLVINVTDGPFRSVTQTQEPPVFGTPAFEWLFRKKEDRAY
jgi:hypothetical protein